MTERDLFMRLFDISINTFYLWKRQGRLIFDLIEKYFTKDDLEEFLRDKKVSRYDAIENSFFSNYIRTSEIIKLFSIYDADTLKNALREALDKNNISFGTVEYLKQKRSKLEVIKKIENLLDDMHHEKQSSSRYISSVPNIENDEKNKSYYEFEKAVTYLNDKLGFDFSESDRVLVYNIISRYRVYNTLYDLDKIPKD